MPDHIAVAKDTIDRLYYRLVDAHKLPDPVRQREVVQSVAHDLRKLADYIDPDGPSPR